MENREETMKCNFVHDLTKEVLKLTEGKDVVDRYHDVLHAVEILKAEMDEALGR